MNLKNKSGYQPVAGRWTLKVLWLFFWACLTVLGGFTGCGYAGNSGGAQAATTEKVAAENSAVKSNVSGDTTAVKNQAADATDKSSATKTNPATTSAEQLLTGEVKATPAPHDYSILIKKSTYKLYLLDHGQPVAVWGVAVGKNHGQKQVRGDMKTPEGTYYIDEIDNASTWTHDFGDGKGEIKGAYGPWFLSLNTDKQSGGKWGGIGIHGTHDPASIGTCASEGCIRLQNENLKKLKDYAKVGMQVKIEE